uniref:NmrA-like domain-containing protein n=1 Tax=Eutreptiella gymnastica TaxID=73025 RepID=A0A7S1HRZ5_9EUGL|mmetsp:Transcript_100950/g.174389  ORF Transcript_100950/g.174389 Transcript_100950/m.174389 type:complete len:389 (+) Transcript_100950:109-1275(+)
MGVEAVQFAFGDRTSADSALQSSGARKVFLLTDFFGAAKGKKDKEIFHGTVFIDACKVAGVEHVVFSSVADCDACPQNVQHFKSKLAIEDYIKSSGLSYSILRPVAFFENLDDPANWNPLKKGSVKCLWPATLKVKMVACVDIAKAAKEMLASPAEWQGKTLDCAACNASGHDLANSLSEVSGVKCSYKKAVPGLAMWLFMRDLYNMVAFFMGPGYSSSIEDFKKVVPDAMGPKDWFKAKGVWSNGEAFKPSGHIVVQPPDAEQNATEQHASDQVALIDKASDETAPVDEASDKEAPGDEVSDQPKPVDEVSDEVPAVAEISDHIPPVDADSDQVQPAEEMSDQAQPVDELLDKVQAVADVSDEVQAVDKVSDHVPPTDAVSNQVLGE